MGVILSDLTGNVLPPTLHMFVSESGACVGCVRMSELHVPRGHVTAMGQAQGVHDLVSQGRRRKNEEEHVCVPLPIDSPCKGTLFPLEM